tara:strand:- start:4357 stop:4578 length:222 start_codon:yes stop_codon:yes gene_type:complete
MGYFVSKLTTQKMAKITIDNKDYEFENLNDESKQQVNNLRFVQTELVRLQSLLNVTKTAEQAYIKALKDTLED